MRRRVERRVERRFASFDSQSNPLRCEEHHKLELKGERERSDIATICLRSLSSLTSTNVHHSVECKMDQKSKVGRVSCRVCGAAFSMGINYLMEPIDVFCEWLDQCEAANQRELGLNVPVAGGGGEGNDQAEQADTFGTAAGAIQDSDSEDDDFTRAPAPKETLENESTPATTTETTTTAAAATADADVGEKRKFESADLGFSSDSDSD